MRLLLPASLILVLGCSGGGASTPRFRVVRIEPDPRAGPLRLNRELEIQFAGAVDPVSVTTDSIQILDAAGSSAEGTFEVSDFVVKFWPRPPVTPELADGTWKPGARYTLRILGFPSPKAVREQRTGAFLPITLELPLRVVDLGSGEAPFLPEDRAPFVLVEPFPVRVADDGRRLVVRMSKPPDPRTLSVQSFGVRDPENRALQIQSWTLAPAREPVVDGAPAWRVDLHLAEPMRSAATHYLVLGDAAAVPRDYGGEPLAMFPHRRGLVAFALQQDLGDSLLREGFDDPTHASAGEAEPSDTDGVLAWCGRQLRPFLLAAAGDGRLGPFHPRQDTVLEPGVSFDPGTGAQVTAPDGDFQFSSVHIPAGVRVTLRGRGPLLLRSQCGVAVAGTLQLETAPLPGRRPILEPLDTWLFARRQDAERAGGGAFLVTSGRASVTGQVVAASPGGVPLVVAAAAGLAPAAAWPAGSELLRVLPTGVRAAIQPGEVAVGAEPDPHPFLHERFRAGALSTWRRLARMSPRQLRLASGPDRSDARIQVACRLAAADPQHPERPHEILAGAFQRGPLLQVAEGAWFAQLRVVMELPPGPCAELPVVQWVQLDP